MGEEDKKLETRVANVEQAIRLLSQLALRADERMDEADGRRDELEEAQKNSERKLAALADAQIRTEENIARLSTAMAELATTQAHTGQRLDALIDIVRERLGGQSQG